MTTLTKAFVSIQGVEAVNDLLDRLHKPNNIRQQDQAAVQEVQEVQDPLYALTNDTDVIELKQEPVEIICSRCGDKTDDQSSPDGIRCPECYDREQDVTSPDHEPEPKIARPHGLEIETILIMGTWHVTEATAKWFDSNPENLVIYQRPQDIGGGPRHIHHGWIIHILNEEETDHSLPHDLWILLEFARKQGCQKVHIDPDGPKISNLQTYDW